MISFQATYFDGRSSRAHAVVVTVSEGKCHIAGQGLDLADVPLADCRISPPLGHTPRVINLPDGSLCTTSDLNAVARIEKEYRINRGMRMVKLLESRWRIIACCLAVLVALVAGFSCYGIPALAERLAFSLPDKVVAELSRRTVAVLDSRLLGRTDLSTGRMDQVTDLFNRVVAEVDTTFVYQLQFRKGGGLGANAFALPSGQIIVTDELVAMAEKQEELAGVFAHEIAHVERRHGLRSILQNAGVFLLISAIAGDIASITSSAASLPTLLLQTGYSRRFEKEADAAAADYFIRKNESTGPFQDILRRMSKDRPQMAGESLLSTHPVTDSRIRFLQDCESGRL
jgi:Zn-dependent protease with chaperone function